MRLTFPLVSIIIPVYNGERFIGETIENALQQTWPNKEIIIIDDGSTDKSLSISRNFEGADVRVISIQNGGAARARNIGFLNSKGNYVQYLDSDDLMVSDKISIQMDRFLKCDHAENVICAGQWIRFSDSISNTLGGVGPGGPAENDMDALNWLLLKPYNLMTIHAWLTPRSLIEKAGPWNESMTLDDDGEFFIRVVSGASSVLFCKNALTYYRTNVEIESVSKYSGFEKSLDSCAKLRSAYKSMETYRRALGNNNSRRVKKALARNYLLMAFDSYMNCDDIYRKCIDQPEVPLVQRFIILKMIKGKFGLLSLFVGWKLAKRFLMSIKP